MRNLRMLVILLELCIKDLNWVGKIGKYCKQGDGLYGKGKLGAWRFWCGEELEVL